VTGLLTVKLSLDKLDYDGLHCTAWGFFSSFIERVVASGLVVVYGDAA